MKKIALVLLAGVMLSACSTMKRQRTIVGQFSGNIGYHDVILTLNQDGSLILKSSGLYVANSWLDHTGRWEALGKKRTLLKFDKITDPAILLQSGLLVFKGEKNVKFIDENELLIVEDNVILKREK